MSPSFSFFTEVYVAKKVMCVDDSSTIRMLVKKALQPEGYEIVEAENGKEGLEKSDEHEIALFIVDVNMPVMDGFEFVKNVKAKSQYSSAPIIFLTTESGADKKQVGKELGVNGWFVKPFEAPSLAKVVNMLIG
jgi:two-component system chemotaxis response regulator CheY